MCGCEGCIYARSIHSSLLSWRDRYFKNIKDQIQNAQNRRSGGKANCVYETYKNMVMPHGSHIYSKSYYMEKSTMCAYPQSDHALPHCKYIIRWCAKYPSVNLPDQKIDDQYSNTNPSIRFHIYHLIGFCTTHGRLPLNYKKNCRKCKQDSVSEQSTKVYIRKELVMTETKNSKFCTIFYIPDIYKLAFHIPHVQILGKNHCDDSRQTEFKRRE